MDTEFKKNINRIAREARKTYSHWLVNFDDDTNTIRAVLMASTSYLLGACFKLSIIFTSDSDSFSVVFDQEIPHPNIYKGNVFCLSKTLTIRDPLEKILKQIYSDFCCKPSAKSNYNQKACDAYRDSTFVYWKNIRDKGTLV